MAEVRVSVQDSEVHVTLSDEVVVKLPENATTGYRWDVHRIDGGLRVIASDYELPDRLLPGAGGTRVVRVRPTAVGEWQLDLLLKQPWGQDVADRFSVRISVDGPGVAQ